MNSKRFFSIIVIMLILIAGGIGFWYWSQQEEAATPTRTPTETPQDKSAVGTAKTISESVPEIQTNPGEDVPEINPLDRTNPFKYVNPLR